MKPLHIFSLCALLALGTGWFGLGLVEAGAIFLGAVIVVFAAERADDAQFAHRPSAGWICAIVLGASIAIAGAFDLFNVGRDTELGDWDTGFIFGLAILGPIALLHIWNNRRKVKTLDGEGAGLVALVLGVLVMDIAVTDQWAPVGQVGQAAIAAAAGFLASMTAQIRARKALSRPRLLGDLIAAALIATGLRLPFGSTLLSIALFGVAWGVAVLGVTHSRAERVRDVAARVFRRSVMTGAVNAGLLFVLVFGAFAPRVNSSVAGIVAAWDDVVPLPQWLFARLIMRDRYLWAGVPVGHHTAAGHDPNSMVEALRYPRDKWSGALPTTVSNSHLSGEDSEGVDLVEEGGVAFVGHVHPGSRAAKAGVKRGWRLVRPVRYAAAKPKVLFTDADGKAHDVDYSDLAAYVSPSWSIIVEHAGRKIGYVYLSHFLKPSVDSLSSSFTALKRGGVEDLVLDLRYNPGGSLGVARHLASLIVGPQLDGKVFQRTIHNEKYRDQDGTTRFERRAEALGLKRVFVLTTKDTCSASEAVITGLAPHIQVVTIGTTTCGKPVGFSPLDYRGTSYWVINFRLRNAANKGDYFGGLAPTCEVKEDLHQTLGSPDEALFAEALRYMDTGQCSKS